MDNTNVSGSESKVPCKFEFENLIDEARSLSETGMVDVVLSVNESEETQFGITKRKRLILDLNQAQDVEDVVSKLAPFSDIQQQMFILRYLCNLTVEEVAKRLNIKTSKVEFGLDLIINIY
ncbi:sigma factor-like helix-turn-helix DNA-binding protein [Sporosarcina gallistercoris]|uniref:sigma factor-like helix-turn-helix DNA-binding protein n=1 Tax=Sporosarcina gallistercoris TaxID=2762245 RepID=UPI003D2AF91F